MFTEVYARRQNADAAAALVEQLRADGHAARSGDVRWFDPAQIDRTAVKVYHDGTDPLIPWVYAQHGIPCELIPGFVGETEHGGEDHHHLRKVEGGFALIDPDGNQVGEVCATEAEAWDQHPNARRPAPEGSAPAVLDEPLVFPTEAAAPSLPLDDAPEPKPRRGRRGRA